MLKSIKATNYDNISLTMYMSDTNFRNLGFAIKKVEGLGPVKGNINTSDEANGNGGIYISSKKEPRNIIITLALKQFSSTTNPEKTRQSIYRTFQIGKLVTLLITTDNRTVTCVGYTESCEPDIFSDNQDVAISIICPDPVLYDTTERSYSGSWNATNKVYDLAPFSYGDCPVGFKMAIQVTGTGLGNFLLTETKTGRVMSIYTGSASIGGKTGIQAGDLITIITKRGEKAITLKRGGVEYSIINLIQDGSSWFEARYGAVPFTLSTGSTSNNASVKMTWYDAFEGV